MSATILPFELGQLRRDAEQYVLDIRSGYGQEAAVMRLDRQWTPALKREIRRYAAIYGLTDEIFPDGF